MKLPGNHHPSLLLGEEKWEKNLDANSWPDTMHLPTPLPSDSSAPVRATPPPPPSSPAPGLGGAFPILIGASPPAPRPLAQGATSFRVHLGDDVWPCAHPPFQLSRGMSVAPTRALRAPQGLRPQCLLREGSQELPQRQLLRVMFWLWGDFSNVPKRCGRRRMF